MEDEGKDIMRANEFTGGDLRRTAKYAKSHYNEPNELRALLKWLARSSMHGLEDDKAQFQVIAQLVKDVKAIKAKLNDKPTEVIKEASYDGMVNSLRQNYPDQVNFIDDQLKWAKTILKKDERVVWWLRLVTSFLKTGEIPLNATENSPEIGELRASIEHFFGYPVPAIQNYQFAKKFPEQVLNDLTQTLNQWEQEQSQKNIKAQPVYPQKGDYKLIDFGNGTAWWFVNRAYCPDEGRSGRHCGNVTGQNKRDQRILSFRVGGDETHAGHVKLTFILEPDGKLGEMKAYHNQKPAEKLHPYIMALLMNPIVKGIQGGGYLEENNFSVFDLSEKDIATIQQKKPELIADQISVSPAQAIKAPQPIRKQYYNEIVSNTKGINEILNPDGSYNDSDEAWDRAISINPSLSLLVSGNRIDRYKNQILETLKYDPVLLIKIATRDIRRNFDILSKFVTFNRENIGLVQPTTPGFLELCKIAIEANIYSIEYIPEEYRNNQLRDFIFKTYPQTREWVSMTTPDTLEKIINAIKKATNDIIGDVISDFANRDEDYYDYLSDVYPDGDGMVDWDAVREEDSYENYDQDIKNAKNSFEKKLNSITVEDIQEISSLIGNIRNDMMDIIKAEIYRSTALDDEVLDRMYDISVYPNGDEEYVVNYKGYNYMQ